MKEHFLVNLIISGNRLTQVFAGYTRKRKMHCKFVALHPSEFIIADKDFEHLLCHIIGLVGYIWFLFIFGYIYLYTHQFVLGDYRKPNL